MLSAFRQRTLALVSALTLLSLADGAFAQPAEAVSKGAAPVLPTPVAPVPAAPASVAPASAVPVPAVPVPAVPVPAPTGAAAVAGAPIGPKPVVWRNPVPMHWMQPPAERNPTMMAGIGMAALGGVSILGGVLLAVEPAPLRQRCDFIDNSCEFTRAGVQEAGSIALITSGVTSAALGTTLALLGAADPLTYPHRDSDMALTSASITILGGSLIVGGMSTFFYSQERDEDSAAVGLTMLASGFLAIPVGVPMWFRGSSHPDLTDAARKVIEQTTPQKHYVTRSPAMAATGGTFVGLGIVGAVATGVGTFRILENDTEVDDDLWFVGGAVMTTASAALLIGGIPMLASGLKKVAPAEAYAFQRNVEPWLVPKIDVGAGNIQMTWQLQ